MIFAPLRTSPLPLLHSFRQNPTRFRQNLTRFRQHPTRFRSIPCKMTVSSSIIGSVNVIAAAASVATGSSAHGAVTSAITQVAVTAVAIASGACLSTKVDFLWPKVEEQPGAFTLDGVDVTGSPIFYDEKVQKAIAFARKAHQGQLRRTGEPYLTHCIHTGQIVSVLVPSSGKQAIDTVVAAILHDVVDDTCESLHSIEESFGNDIANLVAGVSRLSFINQLLRRHRRINVHEGNLCHEEANNLRVMLLGMVDDPRVVLIKLADRLHNMRTIYALPASKAQAVAQETLLIWCSLASRLGLWALKAELEDLCFAVLQPEIFRQMRADLASMWISKNKAGNLRRTSTKASSHEPLDEERSSSVCVDSVAIDEDVISLRDLLKGVLPFDLLLDRGKRANFLHNLEKYAQTNTKSKAVKDAGIALASLAICEEALERELFISTSYVPGMEVSLSSRLKSLYSIYSKMKRKDVGINKVYDARALRVIVGDKNGSLHGPAVKCCYSLLDIIHRLWPPIDGELDDYIINPKPSGYQSLHTALQGPDCSPLEVQIRTQRMHEYAEHGLAAHWLYKETANTVPSINISNDSKLKASPSLSSNVEQNCVGDDVFQKYRILKVGHPALRVEGSHLLAAVVVRVVKGGRELLVAVSFDLASSEAVADRKSSFQVKRWEAYARLYKKVSDEWWFEPGHGDWCTCLEKYVLCRDGIYHKQDQFGRILPTFIQMINLTEHEELEYRAVVSAVLEGRQVASLTSNPSHYNWPKFESNSSNSSEASINNKVRLLRTMLQWEEELYSEAGLRQTTQGGKVYGTTKTNTDVFGEVVIVCLPHGEIMRLRTGSTAADAAIRVGLDGKLVLVNGQVVLPCTELKDGDVIEVRV